MFYWRTKQQLGNVLKMKRIKLGFSQEYISLETSIDRMVLSSLENGRANPTLLTLLKLCGVFHIKLWEVEEEGGIKAKIANTTPVKVFYSYIWNDIQIDKTVYYYLMTYVSGDPKNHDWEMMDAKFMSEKNVNNILSYPSDKEAFKQILLLLE